MKKNIQNKTFGSYIPELRIKNDIGQRELTQKIGIAASYLNDIEESRTFYNCFNLN
jgi:transcriptional regulator with XRE-family HTH domain